MFVNPSEKWFFSRTKKLLSSLCDGSPSSCKDYRKFYEAFDVRPFSSCETQSFVGLLLFRKNTNLAMIYKISQEEDNVIMHEYEVMRQLDGIAHHCPHFVRLYGLVDYCGAIPISPLQNLRMDAAGAMRHLLLLEYVHYVSDFEAFIDSRARGTREIVSLVAQIFVAIRVMRARKITHNDLHCENILIRQCPPNLVLEYVLPSGRLSVPSYGNIAVIIDFGLGRSEPTDASTPLLGTMGFSHYGFHVDSFSPAVDYVRFISSLRTICQSSYTGVSKWCTTLLKPIKYLDYSIGWDTFSKTSAADAFNQKIHSKFKNLTLTENIIWIENLQLLISRPLAPMDELDINVFKDFFHHWKKFEERIRSLEELNYIFRSLVLAVKMWRTDYLEHDTKAVEKIKQDFLRAYEKVIKFHCPSVDYEAMICSLLLGASYLEGFYYRHLQMLQSKTPKRGGPLMWDNRDDAVWKSLMETFGDKLVRPHDAQILRCHLAKLMTPEKSQ